MCQAKKSGTAVLNLLPLHALIVAKFTNMVVSIVAAVLLKSCGVLVKSVTPSAACLTCSVKFTSVRWRWSAAFKQDQLM